MHTRQFIFHAQHVLLCTNAYSKHLDPYFNDKVIPTRGQVLVTEPLKEAVLDACGYSDYGFMYYRMTFNRLLIGGGRNHHKPAEHDTTDDRVTDPVQRTLKIIPAQKVP